MDLTAAPAVGVTVVGLVKLLRYSLPSGKRAGAHAYAVSVNLDLPLELESSVARRLALRERAGAATGLLLAWVTAFMTPEKLPSEYGPLPAYLGVLGAFFVGHAVGCGVAAWYEATRPVALAGQRIARASTPRHGDYVARHERYGSWVAAGVSIAVAVATVVAERRGAVELGPGSWGLVAVGLVGPLLAVAADEVGASVVLGRRQVASNTLELAWDDALRARTLRDMANVPMLASVWSPLLLLVVVGSGLDGGWSTGLDSWAVRLLFIALLVLAIVSLVLQPHRHFRKRLWPTPGVASENRSPVVGPAR